MQCRALFKIRLSILKRRWKISLIQSLIFLGLSILTIYLGQNSSDYFIDNGPGLNLDLSIYGASRVFYGGTSSDPYFTETQGYYGKVVTSQGGLASKVESVSNAIINKGIENIAFYKQHMIVGAEFNVSSYKERIVNAMYSNGAIHGAPISINMVMNAILKSTAGDQYSIHVSNKPLEGINSNSSPQSQSEDKVSVIWLVIFPLGILYFVGSFLILPLMERTSNVKQLELMTGIRPFYYWLISYIFDLLLYFTVAVILIICVLIYGSFDSIIFSGTPEIIALFAILMAYGFSGIPYSYLFSYKKSAAGGLTSFLISSLFIGQILTIVVIVMEISRDEYFENLGHKIKIAALFLPHFGLTYSSVQFSRKAVRNHNWDIKSASEKKSYCYYHPTDHCCSGDASAKCIELRSYFTGTDIPIECILLFMVFDGLLYFALLLLVESGRVQIICDKLIIFICRKFYPNLEKISSCTVEDGSLLKPDALDASTKVNQESNLLTVKHLNKVFGGRHHVVKGINFSVKPGDCFGLLGTNGAGKTTTFRMLTGDEYPTDGTVEISNDKHATVDIRSNPLEFLKNVGYCPQFDAINEVLSGREMLQLFAQLRGIPKNEGDSNVNYWIETLGLSEYADIPCGEYSGGNKRKLSMAISLIGNCSLVMLDEPTTGVDPASRRKLWDVIALLQKNEIKPSIILTSHSMEECEALCNRLAIMKNGKIHCTGTVPYLKQKYGKGFTVMLKLKSTQSVNYKAGKESTELLEESIDVQKDFEEKYKNRCMLRDKHMGLLHYHIADTRKTWSQLFEDIENMKHRHPIIEDYNISETTLEEVFLSIARDEEETEKLEFI